MPPESALGLLRTSSEYQSVLESLRYPGEHILYGLSGSMKSLIVSSLSKDTGRPALVITSTIAQAERFREDLATWLPDRATLLFSPMEYLPFEVVAHSPEVVAQRLEVLERLVRAENVLVVAPVAALQRALTPPEAFVEALVKLEVGSRVPRAELLSRLVRLGYERVEMVEGRGQFSLRGEILDVWPLAQGLPVRVEFFDDEVDRIRQFDPGTQRSYEEAHMRVEVGPAREFILPPGDLRPVVARIEADLAQAKTRLEKLQAREVARLKDGVLAEMEAAEQAGLLTVEGGEEPEAEDGAKKRRGRAKKTAASNAQRVSEAIARQFSAAERLEERVLGHLAHLREGHGFEGVDQYAAFFYDRLATLLDYFFEQPVVVVDETARIREGAREMELRDQERQVSVMEKGGLLPGQMGLYRPLDDLFALFRRYRTLHLSLLVKAVPGLVASDASNITAQAMQEFHGQWPLFQEELKRWRGQKYRILLVAGNSERRDRLRTTLFEAGIESAEYGERMDVPAAGTVAVTVGNLEQGFQWPGLRLTVVTDGEIYGRPKRRRRTLPEQATTRDAARIASYQDLKVGDYVVHANHGIGKYMGVASETVLGVTRDYLVIRYEGTDRLKIPTDQIDQIQKYLGAEGHEPKLNKLGSSEWNKVKSRVKESIREMAAELLRLAAIREAQPGHAFAPDTLWQGEFEDAFSFEETPDQLRSIGEIKRDMEKGRPMDRLLLGDVGYGKTEVALRAAFKALADGKQVALLVPTTILAQQHYATCMNRMGSFPFRIDVLNRFRSTKEQNETLKAISEGRVDLIIGTHRLLSDDIHFKDLGLVIVDEEQRFGVQHKEKLKQMRFSVDMLTLSATPIPRTLHMAMVGLRDMSVITSPPEDRFPVETYVAEYDEELIRDAIGRELHRGGQVYFVHNRVQSIDRVAAQIQRLVPEARVVVAHGQMKEDKLERVMMDFLEGEYDVLVATTIIESGVDIPVVNTILVDDADHLGLSQLYQLRGRVGRSNRLAYAYFMYKRDRLLTEVAEKRLAAIKDFTELGSGFKIAMRDLEIRGAGNILGPEQHGFIVSVGFDLYAQLMEEAINELKGVQPVKEIQASVELNVDAFISDQYIEDPRQKIDAYKRIIAIRSDAHAHDVEEELEDRYGALPQPVRNLLNLARVKARATDLGVTSIHQIKDRVTIKMLPGRLISPDTYIAIGRRHKNRVQATGPKISQMVVRTHDWTDADLLLALLDILEGLREPLLAGQKA